MFTKSINPLYICNSSKDENIKRRWTHIIEHSKQILIGKLYSIVQRRKRRSSLPPLLSMATLFVWRYIFFNTYTSRRRYLLYQATIQFSYTISIIIASMANILDISMEFRRSDDRIFIINQPDRSS